MKHTIVLMFIHHMYIHCLCQSKELMPGNILFIVAWLCLLLIFAARSKLEGSYQSQDCRNIKIGDLSDLLDALICTARR